MHKTIQGDILDVNVGIIVHQVNCKKKMASGLASQIRNKYPQHYKDFMNHVPVLGSIVVTKVNPSLFVVGVYGQDSYGYDGAQYTNYEALENGFKMVKTLSNETDLGVFIPMNIGCGLGGGKWTTVVQLIDKVFDSVTIIQKN